MPANPSFQFSLLAFPQRFDGSNIQLRILALPQTNPLTPMITGVAPGNSSAFADAKLVLNAALIPSLAALPQPGNVTAQIGLALTAPTQSRNIFQQIQGMVPIGPEPAGTGPKVTGAITQKYLPPSYRAAFAFDRPGPYGVIDDTYACLMSQSATAGPPPPTTVSWGRIFAFALRTEVLAMAVGLMYETSLALPSPTFFSNGGWLFVTLDPTSDFAPQINTQPSLLQCYAARIPALSAARPLYAAVLFPVTSTPLSGYDTIFPEAENYDDGFAKIVHGAQLQRALFTDTSANGLPPVGDYGIRLGWDDEQIALWMNRQMDATAVDAPVGTSSYRVDVRPHGIGAWSSLCLVTGNLQLGSTPLGTFNGELGVETPPIQPDPTAPASWWLASYFASWRGKSVVLADADALQTSGGPDPSPTRQFQPVGENTVPLLYGNSYDFRVRLSDLARGGPQVGDSPINPAPAPIGTIPFRRYTPPKVVSITNLDTSATPANPQTMYSIQRPRLGYPDLAFTGYPNAIAALLADIPNASAQQRDVGLPDPDVVSLGIDVEVRQLDQDAAAITATDHSPYGLLYSTTRDFPADPTALLNVNVSYQDFPELSAFPAQPTNGNVVVPTARDIRLTFYAICKPDPNLAYFGTQQTRIGFTLETLTRANSSDERNLFVPDAPADQFRAIMLQPDPVPTTNLTMQLAVIGQQGAAQTDLMGRLATALNLNVNGLTLSAPGGKRVVFGCSQALRNILSPDHGSITFASKNELTRQWITVLTIQLQRDWTWDGLADVSFLIADQNAQPIGTIDVTRGLTATALTQPDRSTTLLIFFDAIDPKPAPGAFPAEKTIGYTITPQFAATPAQQDPPPSLSLELPMATPSSQTPQLASAGIALSPYIRAADYSSTQARKRVLWLEFAQPVANPRDAYFARVLNYAPDPLLTGDQVLSGVNPIVAPPEPPLPIDPELIRIITPGDSDDSSGLNAMQQLIPSDSPLHYGIPLPPGLTSDSPELFGFFVYELRVGHAQGWSTAQGRFGRSLRVTGVQHPAPVLLCSPARVPDLITVSAPYALPVFGGQNLTPAAPRTEMWLLLYAQVTQADNADYRNVLLSRKPAALPDRRFVASVSFNAMGVPGYGYWDQPEVEALLSGLGLPLDSPLSVLAVEVLPEVGRRSDPLGSNLGYVRVLRTSPLAPVPPTC